MTRAGERVSDFSESTRGRVIEFDEHRGLGMVETETGELVMFHCIELSDGTRRIDVGTRVEFEIRPKFSRPEAFSLRRIDSSTH